MRTTARFDAHRVRDSLLVRGGPNQGGFVPYAYRPFDNRWLYWEAETKLLDEKRASYRPHVFKGNLWLATPQKQRRNWSPPPVVSVMGDINHMDGSTSYIPAYLRDSGLGIDGIGTYRRPNLSTVAELYLERLGLNVEDLFHHVLAVLHDPAYREANAGALRMEWPRIPLPGWPDGDGTADELATSAARGRELAALLDSDTSVPGVTEGELRSEIAVVAVPSTVDGGNMAGDDFALTAGWGHFGQGQAVMAGPRPCRRAPLHDGRTRSFGRGRVHSRQDYVRHLPERPGLLVQRPRLRVELQARRLPGPQEVAVV